MLCAAVGYTAHRPPALRLLGHGVSGWVAAHKQALFIGRTTKQRTVGLPLMANGYVLGTLVARQSNGSGLTDTQVRWLTSMAALLASALHTPGFPTGDEGVAVHAAAEGDKSSDHVYGGLAA